MSAYRLLKSFYRSVKRFGVKNDEQVTVHISDLKIKFGDILGKPTTVQSTKTLLIHSSHNLTYCMNMESVLAKSLQLEFGWQVIFLCDLTTKQLAEQMPRDLFGFQDLLLYEDYMPLMNPAGVRELFKKVDNAVSLDEIESIMFGIVPVGLHALARYSGSNPSGTIGLTKRTKSKLKAIISNAARYSIGAENVLNSTKPDLILSVEKGTIGTSELYYHALAMGVDYVQYSACHQPNSIMLKRYNISNQRMHPFSVSDQSWATVRYDDQMKVDVVEAFEDGYKKGEWFKYKNLADATKIISKTELIEKLDLDPNKKVAIIFSHILNDANFYYGKDLFEGGFREWLVKTVEVARENHNVNWVIKLHPANMYRRKRQNYSGEFGEIIALKEHFGVLPSNIKIIPADTAVNPYSFFMLADYAVTVRGTIGAELPCFGIPVITAGTGRYSGKGFTLDSNTVEEYLGKIKNIHLFERLSADQIQMANKHAYLFFKMRPARYDGFMVDTYPDPSNTIISRDIEPVDNMIWENKDLISMSLFLSESSDEDYLSQLGL
jgi:hypothetical protein